MWTRQVERAKWWHEIEVRAAYSSGRQGVLFQAVTEEIKKMAIAMKQQLYRELYEDGAQP